MWIVPARAAHFPVLASAMRLADRRECAALGYEPMRALQTSLTFSTMAWTGLVDRDPVCMFGVTARFLLDREAEPWLLATDGIMPHRMAFLRRNREYVRQMLDLYPVLAGMVDARNRVSIRWLRWIGFSIGRPQPHGLAGEPFRPFRMEA